jgi:methionine aminopeptidase
MDTRKIVINIVALMALALPSVINACHIELTPDKESIKAGDIVQITVTTVLEHRNCVLEKDDYQLELSDNASILKQGTWTETKRGVFTNTFTIKINEPGLFSFRVFRDCSKKGISEGDLSYQVK